MSAGWQVGDLALCVDEVPDITSPEPHLLRGMAGKTFMVAGSLFNGGLDLVERSSLFGFRPSRFRKIRPDEREACEPEFVTLLNRIKRKIGVAA